MRSIHRRSALLLAASTASLWLAACAQLPPAQTGSQGEAQTAWSGRLSLRIGSEPVQTFSALFDLSGTASAGELTLTTPIGSTLAAMYWAPGEAVLKNGRDTRHFDSVDTLIEAATGAAIPIRALFSWLAGQDESITGWHADLSQISAGRLQATRVAPLPGVELRIAFERQ